MTAILEQPQQLDLSGETVTSVCHWSDTLFSFRLTRPSSFRFRSGEFVMIGLLIDGKPLYRAYSIASATWDEELEFYSIKVPDGTLTSRLSRIEIGDKVLIRPRPTGTLVLDTLLSGRNCYLVSSGTGIAPFASLLRDSELYKKFDKIILTHTVRLNSDLSYGKDLISRIMKDSLIGESAQQQLLYYGTTTRESSSHNGRITDLLRTKVLFTDLSLPILDSQDRVMICGSLPFNHSLKDICVQVGLVEGSNSRAGTFVLEKAFVG